MNLTGADWLYEPIELSFVGRSILKCRFKIKLIELHNLGRDKRKEHKERQN